VRLLFSFTLFCCATLATGADYVTPRADPAARLVNAWWAEGTAAGLAAITYENRDGQHSQLDTLLYPQLQVLKGDVNDKGPARAVRPIPVIGNCSMASAPEQVGCLPRLYMSDPAGSDFLAKQYFSNNHFIYPEHLDHDKGGSGVGGYGDLLPLNTPMITISQGSSSSDQPFLRAFMTAAAALRPETQKVLIEKKLLVPTLQAIFRRSNRMVSSDADYFSGKAHPVVFEADQINEEKMVRMAHEITPESIPPVAVIEVKEETKAERGRQWFEPEGVAYFTDTANSPVSIGRIFRENTSEHGFLVSLDRSFAAHPKQKLSARLVVLQGDPRFVSIEQQPGIAQARVRVRWQPPVQGARGTRSHRIDIGAFATDGQQISAPAILSIYMLPNEMRYYDDKGRLVEIHYQTANPELGLPQDDRDLRWVRLMSALAEPGEGTLMARLAQPLLTPAEREAIRKIRKELQKNLDAAATVARNPKLKDQAEKQRSAVLDDLAKALDGNLPGEKPRPLRFALLLGLELLASDPMLFIQNQAEVLDLAARSPKATAAADVRAELHRLTLTGILKQEKDGVVRTTVFPKKLGLGERHALRGLNLTILSHVLLPQVLERAAGTAWFPPRLTSLKPWRDVMHYEGETARLTGWTRHHEGRTTAFDAEGRLLPPTPGSKPMAVTYVLDGDGKLTWKAK